MQPPPQNPARTPHTATRATRDRGRRQGTWVRGRAEIGGGYRGVAYAPAEPASAATVGPATACPAHPPTSPYPLSIYTLTPPLSPPCRTRPPPPPPPGPIRPPARPRSRRPGSPSPASLAPAPPTLPAGTAGSSRRRRREREHRPGHGRLAATRMSARDPALLLPHRLLTACPPVTRPAYPECAGPRRPNQS